jgi:Tc5 transposase DNA-binding domain
MHDFLPSQPTSLTAMDSTKNDRIKAAIDQLDSQKALNYAAAARDHHINRTTLARRYNGKTVSRAEANSTYRQRLNDVQEDTLLRYIDTLTDRHIPPTSQIIKNLAEEIIKGPMGKRTSIFLHSLSHQRFILNNDKGYSANYIRLLLSFQSTRHLTSYYYFT